MVFDSKGPLAGVEILDVMRRLTGAHLYER
jgi:hypothetical protein